MRSFGLRLRQSATKRSKGFAFRNRSRRREARFFSVAARSMRPVAASMTAP